MVKQIVDYLKKINIYKISDEYKRNEIISTRIFLILFILSLTGLAGYASLSLQLTIIHIPYPSQPIFEQYQLAYSKTLSCPCTHTSIQLDKLLTIEVEYHQICSSLFIDDQWLLSISNRIPQIFYSLDVRRMLSSQLQILAFYCHLSKAAVMDALRILSLNHLFIPTMISRERFRSEIEIIIEEVLKDKRAELNQTRHLIQSIFQQNQLVSALESNFLYGRINDFEQYFSYVKFLKDQTYPPALINPADTSSALCSCLDLSSCVYPAGIYPSLTGVDSYTYRSGIVPTMISSVQIPGLYAGCVPLDSLIESSLECFYSDQCLSILFNRTDLKPLNASLKSNYSLNTKVKILIEQLFIENLKIQTNFSSLYVECQPINCSYSYNSAGTITFILFTILSLIGGLFISLKTLSLLFVKIIYMIRDKIRQRQTSSETENKNNSICLIIKRTINSIRDRIVQLNLFNDSYDDDHRRKLQIISTRIYLSFMLVAIVIIGFYASINEHTLTYHINSPSFKIYSNLVHRYPSLTCECQQITSAYSKFISFTPKSHPICSSIYASEFMIPKYGRQNTIIELGVFSFQVAVASYSSIARTMCTISHDTISQAIETFLQTIYVSRFLIHENEFHTRIQLAINNFKISAPTQFRHLIQLIRNNLKGNYLLAAGFSNAKLKVNMSAENSEDMIDILWMYTYNQSCQCQISLDSCSLSYDAFCNYTFYHTDVETCRSSIPGLSLSCYQLDGILTSKLQCFYDMDCIMPFLITATSWTGLPLEMLIQLPFLLNSSDLTYFSVDSTVDEIFNELSIENWNEAIAFHSYFTNCNPSYCSYTITKRFDLATILTIMISLMGGISVILKISIPLSVKLIQSRQIPNRNFLFELNFFKTYQTNHSEEIRRNQIISTRIYILLLTISIVILSIYTIYQEKITTVNIKSSSLSQIQQFQSQYLNEFICHCSKITISYETFTSFNFTFHQICSSDLISMKWLESISIIGNEKLMNYGVFMSHFQLLQSFCQLSETIVSDAIKNFYANQLISIYLLNRNEFTDQSETFINQFQMQTMNSFRSNLGLLINITLGNQLLSAYQTSWSFEPRFEYYIFVDMKAQLYQSNNCSCASLQASICADPLIIGENTSVVGMMIGCLPLTSLRLSTLQCFYNQTCFDEVKNVFNLQNLSIEILNSTQSTRFSLNETLSTMIDNLMLETWSSSIDYDQYFHECNPQQCTYSHYERSSTLTIFSTLLGLYGGLTIILSFITSSMVTLVKIQLNRHRIRPQQE